jgi:hypothetical protein
MGITNPLLDVPMRRKGRTVFVEIGGLLFDPASGQLLLQETESLILRFLLGDQDLPSGPKPPRSAQPVGGHR